MVKRYMGRLLLKQAMGSKYKASDNKRKYVTTYLYAFNPIPLPTNY
jgi:hypothetical protein